jgi:hypothetical protein
MPCSGKKRICGLLPAKHMLEGAITGLTLGIMLSNQEPAFKQGVRLLGKLQGGKGALKVHGHR